MDLFALFRIKMGEIKCEWCIDIDECSVFNESCHAQAFCYNTEGNFTCTCQSGYIGDGFNCTGNNICMPLVRQVCFLCIIFARLGNTAHRSDSDHSACLQLHSSTVCRMAVWQWQPKLVQTVQQHCLVWIYLDTQNMWLYLVECSLLRAV